MRPRNATRVLFFVLFLVLIAPFLQHCFSFIESGKLYGYVPSNPDVQFSYAKWWDGSYQKQKNNYLNDSTGFRPDFVRVTNEIDYLLFKKLHTDEGFLGKDGQLFIRPYVDEYFGVDQVPVDIARDELIKLKKIQDTLEHLGKTMVFAYAPSKAYFLPDKIPDCLRVKNIKTSNYHNFKRIGDSLHINQLDLNAYFIAMRDTSKNMLITKQGGHWSDYGALLGGDSLTKYIERLRNISMPELTIEELQYSEKPRHMDAEIGGVLNLIAPINVEKYCYPRYNFTSKGGKTRPKVIYICDSYMWPLSYEGYFEKVNEGWECWYYFREVWNLGCIWGREEAKPMATYQWQKSLLSADCLVILFTSYNLAKFPNKDFFLETIYNYFYPAGNNKKV